MLNLSIFFYQWSQDQSLEGGGGRGAISEVCSRLLWLFRRLCACHMSSSIHTSAFSLFSLVKNNTTCQMTCY